MGGPEDTDELLMLRYKDGDTEAFDVLYHRHKGPVYRFVRRQCTDSPTADELFQDVWMNLIRSRARYRVQAKFTTFLYRIAHNRLIDFYRSSVKHSLADTGIEIDELVGSRGDSATRLDTERRYQELRRRILALPGEQREAFLMHEEGGFSVAEIAAITGVRHETAKSRLRYALGKLREGWLEEES